MNTLLALPFSDFYFDLIKKGIYREDYWQKFVLDPVPNYLLPSWRGEEMDKVFIDIRDEIMKKYYLSPSLITREAFNDIIHFDFGKLSRKIKIGFDIFFDRAKT